MDAANDNKNSSDNSRYFKQTILEPAHHLE